MSFLSKYIPYVCMLSVYLFLASIYPARRHAFHYAVLFKIFYISICCYGVYELLKKKFSAKFFPWLMGLFGGVVILSVLTGFYSVRAGSELDILLAAIGLSFLFWIYGSLTSMERLKCLGFAILFFVHFAICLTLVCETYHYPFSYPWPILIRDFLFNVTSCIQFLTLKEVCCPFDYLNYAGYFGVLTFPFFFGLMLADQKKWTKYLWAYGAFCSLSIVFISRGRGAWAVLLLVLICLFFAYIYTSKGARLKKIGIAFLVLTLCVAFGYYKSHKVAYLLNAIVHLDFKRAATQRWFAAQDCFSVAKTKPLFGHGITTTPLHYLESKPNYVHHCWQVHVAPVQFWVEFGFLGGILWGLILLFILYSSLKRLRNKSLSSERKYATFGCILTWIAYLLFNSEASWDIFSISCFVCFIGGFLLLPMDEKKDKPLPQNSVYILKIISLSLLILLISYSFKDIMGRYYFEKFYEKAVKNQPSCEDELKKAIQWDPHNLHYWDQGGYWFASKGFLKNKTLAQKAIFYYETSIEMNPNQLEVLESLGALYASLGDNKRGIDYFCKTIQCLPYRTYAYLQLLEVLKQEEEKELYDEWFATLMFIWPNVVLSQPDLAAEFRERPDLQERYFEHFVQYEKHQTHLVDNSAWQLKKYFIKKLLFNEQEPLQVKDKTILQNANWLCRLMNWDEVLDKAWESPIAKRLYFIPLDQHSNMRILLHAGKGPQLKICTIKEITKPFTDISVYPFESNVDKFHIREFLHPLIDKTLKITK